MSGGAGAGSGSGARRIGLFRRGAGQTGIDVDEAEDGVGDGDEEDCPRLGCNGGLRSGGRSMRPRWSCCCGLVERTRGESDAQQNGQSMASQAREAPEGEDGCWKRILIS